MTYKLNPFLERITSPVRLIYPNGVNHVYDNGHILTEIVFDKKYEITSIRASGDQVEVTLNIVSHSDGIDSFF